MLSAHAQTASSSRPKWRSAFRLVSSSSLSAPVFYSAWLPDQSRANPVFDWRGGVVIQSPLQNDAACRRIAWNEDPNTLAMEWQTSAPNFELLCAPTGGSWRVMVRDTNVSAWTTLGQWSSTGWNAPRVQVFDEETGARHARRFRVEYANQLAWGIRLERRESIAAHPPTPFLRRVLWCGDSFIEGVQSPSMWQGFAGQASAILGLDAQFDASGGTGYLNDGPVGKDHARYIRRLSNIVLANPSVVVMYGSVNDIQFPPAQVARAAGYYWSVIHHALPNAQIIVIGPIRMGTYWNTGPLNDALQQMARNKGLSYIDASDWITGTGKAGYPQGDGNADTFLSGDGTHPTTAGHIFLGRKVAEALRPFLLPN